MLLLKNTYRNKINFRTYFVSFKHLSITKPRELQLKKIKNSLSNDNLSIKNDEYSGDQKFIKFAQDLNVKKQEIKEKKSQDMRIYFVPLKDEDNDLIKEYFDEKTQRVLIEGGRISLFHAINAFNKVNEIKIEFDFIPLTLDELEELQRDFKTIVDDDELHGYIIQEGKKMYDEIKKIKDEQIDNMFKLPKDFSPNENDNDDQIIEFPFSVKKIKRILPIEDGKYIKLIEKQLKSDHLLKLFEERYMMYYNVLKDLTNENNETKRIILDEILEKGLFEKSMNMIENLTSQKLKILFEKTENIDVPIKTEIVQKVLIKGLSADRDSNDTSKDYIYIDTQEKDGLRYFMHKYFAGFSTRFSDNLKNMTSIVKNKGIRNNPYSISHEMKQKNRQIIVRIYMYIKHPYLMNIAKSNDDQDKSDSINYEKDYNYLHFAVFENQLIPPQSHDFTNYGFDDWLSKHKIDHDEWKIVDLDNFMEGNSFFPNDSIPEESDLNKDFSMENVKLDENRNYDELDKFEHEISNLQNEKILKVTQDNLGQIVYYIFKRLYYLFQQSFLMIKEGFMNDEINEKELEELIVELNNTYEFYESVIERLRTDFSVNLKEILKDNSKEIEDLFGPYYEIFQEFIKTDENLKLKLTSEDKQDVLVRIKEIKGNSRIEEIKKPKIIQLKDRKEKDKIKKSLKFAIHQKEDDINKKEIVEKEANNSFGHFLDEEEEFVNFEKKSTLDKPQIIKNKIETKPENKKAKMVNSNKDHTRNNLNKMVKSMKESLIGEK